MKKADKTLMLVSGGEYGGYQKLKIHREISVQYTLNMSMLMLASTL
jgi:hypothetical protein